MTRLSAISSGTPKDRNDAVAILALTRRGTELAERISRRMPESDCFCNARYALPGMTPMRKMAESFLAAWREYGAIICIMGCGIVVRTVAPLIDNKMVDPAVVVVDEEGRFAVSLLSGHLGGANGLARRVAAITGGQAVITTASDLQDKTAIDLTAQKAGLEVENPRMLARLAAAVLDDEKIWVFDPERLFVRHLPEGHGLEVFAPAGEGGTASFAEQMEARRKRMRSGLGIWVSDMIEPPGLRCLKLRPKSLVVGVGCNRGTEASEILGLIELVLKENGLSPVSIKNFASIDIKSTEPGLLKAASLFKRPIQFCTREQIEGIPVPNPSSTVARHIGAESVCEASALWSAGTGVLLAPKRKSINCTAAIARASST